MPSGNLDVRLSLPCDGCAAPTGAATETGAAQPSAARCSLISFGLISTMRTCRDL